MKQADLTAPVRLNYSTGMLLGADDFEAEQRYSTERARRHHRHLHGSGVVWGLDVTADDDGLRVAPGLALDPAGRELVVPDNRSVSLGDWLGDVVTVCLEYAEEPAGDRFIRETCRVGLRWEGAEPAGPALEAAATCRSADDVERAVRDRATACEAAGDCVALAEVDLTGKRPTVDTTVRAVLCDDRMLFALVLRLFDRVDELERQLRERPC